MGVHTDKTHEYTVRPDRWTRVTLTWSSSGPSFLIGIVTYIGRVLMSVYLLNYSFLFVTVRLRNMVRFDIETYVLMFYKKESLYL